MVSPHIQNSLLFCLIGSVNDLDTNACPSVSSLGAIAMEFGMDITVTYETFSIIFILVTTDVMGDSWCGRFGLWPFRSVAVSVCDRSGLWLFRFVAVSVCGRFGLWRFRFVAVSVCGRFGLWPFRLWPFRFVAVMTCYRYIDCLCLCSAVYNTVLYWVVVIWGSDWNNVTVRIHSGFAEGVDLHISDIVNFSLETETQVRCREGLEGYCGIIRIEQKPGHKQ